MRVNSQVRLDSTAARHDYDSDLWHGLAGALRGIPDYDAPPCRGEHPKFDFPDIEGRSGGNRLHGLMRQPSYARLYYGEALALCSTCPLRGLMGRCLSDTRATDPHFSGVAGGWVLVEGQPVVGFAGGVEAFIGEEAAS